MRIKGKDASSEDTNQAFHKLDNQNSKLAFLVVFLISFMCLEIIFRTAIHNLSIFILSNIDESLRCWFWDYMAFFDGYSGKIFLLLIIVNFKNLYAALAFITISEFTIYLTNILRLFYYQSQPFWIKADLRPCSCEVNYGNPSIISASTIVMFLIFNRIFKSKTSSSINIILNLICSFLVILTSFSRFVQNSHSINQILFGFAIGYSVYYIFFEIFEIKYRDKKQFIHIFFNKYVIRFIYFLLILHILTNFIYYLIDFYSDKNWLDMITKYCDIVPFNFHDNEAYQKVCSIMLSVSIIITVYVEYILIFEGNIHEMLSNNIDMKKREKWNDTSNIKSVIRFLIMYLSFLYIQSIFYEGDPNIDSFIKLLFMRYFLLNVTVAVYLFLIAKFLLKVLNLTKEIKLYERTNESFKYNSNLNEKFLTPTD